MVCIVIVKKTGIIIINITLVIDLYNLLNELLYTCILYTYRNILSRI